MPLARTVSAPSLDAPETQPPADAQALAAGGVAVPYHDAFGILRHTPDVTVERLARRFDTAARSHPDGSGSTFSASPSARCWTPSSSTYSYLAESRWR